jgi:hypothetical protein
MILRFDIKTVSEMNQREHWAVKNKRKKQQQRDFAILWKSKHPNIPLPARITFTRYSCQLMDRHENLPSAFKHIVDELCRQIKMDDGDARLEFRYEQERISKRQHYFTVRIDDALDANK